LPRSWQSPPAQARSKELHSDARRSPGLR
jgi:hypothetical protein